MFHYLYTWSRWVSLSLFHCLYTWSIRVSLSYGQIFNKNRILMWVAYQRAVLIWDAVFLVLCHWFYVLGIQQSISRIVLTNILQIYTNFKEVIWSHMPHQNSDYLCDSMVGLIYWRATIKLMLQLPFVDLIESNYHHLSVID